MNLPAILGILLAIAVAGDGILAKMYVGAKEDLAALDQKFKSFKAQVEEEGKQAKADADRKKAEDENRKKEADDENKNSLDRLHADIVRLRRERDRARASIVPPAPAGSKCPPEQACFDAAGLESAIREFRESVRGLADQASEIEADLNTARKWAQSRP